MPKYTSEADEYCQKNIFEPIKRDRQKRLEELEEEILEEFYNIFDNEWRDYEVRKVEIETKTIVIDYLDK